MIQKNKRTVTYLTPVAVLMFGFGYLLVPLYDVICEITGFNGKTGTISVNKANEIIIDSSRLVSVEFDTNVNSDLQWSFNAKSKKISVHPGEVGEVSFSVKNLANRTIIGQAVPSVVPSKGSIYFNKTECFCFTQQILKPGEQKEMSVRFVVDPSMPASISALVLSYTFFKVPDEIVSTSLKSQSVRYRRRDDGQKI
jgi:cytochrome c oxidase assembly protein subunit 11